MKRLGWNEIRVKAAAFTEEWKDAHYERGETHSFYNDFFEVFGVRRRQVATFEEPVKKLGERQGFIDLFWKGTLLVEHKSAGRDLHAAKVQASDDPAKLLDFSEECIKAKGHRDAIAALNRARDLNPKNAEIKARLERLSKDVDDQAAAGAKEFLPKIEAGWNKEWIDAFLAYRDDFEFAPAAGELMKKFAIIRAEHEGPAEKAFGEANSAFQQGKRDEGYAKYQEIVDNYFAASSYRNVKRWLAERK